MSTKTTERIGCVESAGFKFAYMPDANGYVGVCQVHGSFIGLGGERFASEADAAADTGRRKALVEWALGNGGQLLVVLRAADGKETVLAGGGLEVEGGAAVGKDAGA